MLVNSSILFILSVIKKYSKNGNKWTRKQKLWEVLNIELAGFINEVGQPQINKSILGKLLLALNNVWVLGVVLILMTSWLLGFLV